MNWKALILSGIMAAIAVPPLAMAQQNVAYTVVDSTSVPGLPEEYRDFKWYRFETENFEILSIDWKQGAAIKKDVEELRQWTQRRWGLKDVRYTRKCMILCVPSQDIYKKWFRRDDVDPKIAKSKNRDGSGRDVYGIWIAGEPGFMINRLPEKVGWVNLLNYESSFNIKLPHWLHVGMSVLNNDVNTIRRIIGSLDPNGTYSSRDVFQKTVPSGLDSRQYRARAAALCLLLRKQQFGGSKFVEFMSTINRSGNVEQALSVYGWRSGQDFDRSYNVYVRNLSYDIGIRRTPHMGLTWFVLKKAVNVRK